MRFKPLDNLHCLYASFLVIPLLLPNVLLFVPSFSLLQRLLIFSLNGLPFFIYFFIRLLCREIYEIDDVYVTKYAKGKVVFQIKRSDIVKIAIYKRSVWKAVSFVLGSFFVGFLCLSEPPCTIFSFVYRDCEIFTSYKEVEEARPPLLLLADTHEYVDYLSYKKVQKLCKTLGYAPEIVR